MSTSLLIVDDSAFSRNSIKRNLPEGWDVNFMEAQNGQEALDLCQAVQFDVVFLDLTMPDMDGLEVLKLLQEQDYKARIFVISADKQQSSIETAKERGAEDFLIKPIDAAMIESMLKNNGVF
jgi:CheY-like chemotaxis protein